MIFIKDINGIEQQALVVTDSQMEAIDKTKSAFIPLQDVVVQDESNYYTQKDLRIKLRPKE